MHINTGNSKWSVRMKNLFSGVNFQNTRIFSIRIFFILLWTIIFACLQRQEFVIETKPFFGYTISEKYSMGLPFSNNTRSTKRAIEENCKWFALKGIKLTEEDKVSMAAYKWRLRGIIGNVFVWIIVCVFIIHCCSGPADSGRRFPRKKHGK
jgi:hypothetical protein